MVVTLQLSRGVACSAEGTMWSNGTDILRRTVSTRESQNTTMQEVLVRVSCSLYHLYSIVQPLSDDSELAYSGYYRVQAQVQTPDHAISTNLFPNQNPKLSNSELDSGSSNTLGGGLEPPNFICVGF